MELTALNDIFDANDWTQEPEKLDTYGRDWTKHFVPKPAAIVFPRNTEQVQKLVKWARANKVALVPSGGRTGLSAAAFATEGEVVVSFEKMNQVKEFDPIDQTVTCGPGVITEKLQQYAWDQGYYFPIDFAARGSCQIGGNVATNAGGIKVIRYGLTRNWIAGLEVVTGSGDVLRLNNSLVKNATGYDLRHLFIGSEGTLGFVTEVTVNVTRQPKDLTAFVFGVEELEAVMKIYSAYKKEFPVMAYEMFTELALQYVTAQGHVTRPFETKAPYYVLLELEVDDEQTLERAMGVFEKCMGEGWISDGVISQSEQQHRDLWRLREDITEATAHKSPYKNDVSVRVSKVPQFISEMSAIMDKEYPDFDVVWFGHIGDGNLHINILKPDGVESPDFLKRVKEVDGQLFAMIEKLGGSVSAEHGVGLVKKPFLGFTRSAEEIAYMRSIKKVFDPDGILNPGKIF